MSRIVDQSPDPQSHVKTLMRIGYTMPSAISDILDNSLAADCKNINIYAPPGLENPLISILDDGFGMDVEELIQNMRIGCKDPSLEREKGDLGRFGSGLKTASFSQVRRLTVVTKKEGYPIAAAVWDVDRIEESNSWCLEVLDAEEIIALPEVKLHDSSGSGTQIIWQKLTCFQRGNHSLDHDSELAIHLTDLKKYLALHFHRFMEGSNKCDIYLNNMQIKPTDPFMTHSDGYQEGRSEKMRCKGGHIFIKTHVLPHFKRMEPELMKELGGAEGITQNQGFYIYREGRLINAGGWLGLEKVSQLGALARVQVDVPSTLDHEWSTDVKKASLQLPPRIKKELRKFLSDPIKRSKKVHTYRGKVDKANKFWKIYEDENENTITYQVDPENENLVSLLAGCNNETRTEIIRYLTSLSENIPINHIYQKMSECPNDIDQESISTDMLESIFDKIFQGT